MNMTEEKNLDDVVLYHGSLAELNERSEQQHEFADSISYISNLHFTDDAMSWDKKIKKELIETGYDGLVNRRTISEFCRNGFSCAIEGTPIVKKSSRNFEKSGRSYVSPQY